MAYCLMGIFDVNMPLLYGEGEPKAFQRLQEEIIKHTDDQTIFYWRDAEADSSAFRGLLARSPADFSESSIAGLSGYPEYTRADRDAHPTSTYDKTFGMTNRGLRISLAIVSSGHEWEQHVMRGNDEAVAILECGIRPGRKFYIILARLTDDGHYARVDAHILPRVIHLSSLSPSQAPVRDIFVRQEPVVHHRYKTSRTIAVKFVSDPGFQIASACPEEAWDAKTGRISPIDPYVARGIPGSVGDLKSVMLHKPGLVDLWLKRGYLSNKNPLATAVVHVVDLFPPGVPSIVFTISLRWKSRGEGDEGPYEINVQFD